MVRDQVLGRMAPWSAGGDRRAVRWVAWLVTGLMLEQDARLERIALAMSGPQALASRVRTIRRCLNLTVMLPDRTRRSIAERRRQCGAARYFDSVNVGAHYDAPGASLLQLGIRQVRQDVLRGRVPRVEVALLADDDIRGMPGEGRQLKRFHARK
ncbi:MAG: hypothetical protein ABI780_07240, partial [Ardenticatenales bacterium]